MGKLKFHLCPETITSILFLSIFLINGETLLIGIYRLILGHRLAPGPRLLCIMVIKIFLTGGTFDKEYNELTGKLFFKDTHLPEMLSLGRNRVPVDMQTLMMIDSLEMTETHHDLIAQSVMETKENRIIITHGTDTIVETARVLAEKCKNKTIVLVGAMIPYKFGSSDGLFNLGAALAFAQSLPPGVYIAMNGQYFTHDNCRKNRKTGYFETLK